MPVISNEQASDAKYFASYFKSLSDLDEWALNSGPRYQRNLDGILDFVARGKVEGKSYDSRGKLLVCHDYKGGYTEGPSSLAYTFNFWDRCDTFIYFSHHRVTIPPPGWINAAHKHGVKMLGVLIFEHHESAEDILRLLVGKLPKSRTGTSGPSSNTGLPVSPHYARLLADLAHERGFDGYLLNFEYPFEGRSEQVRALEAWIAIFNAELKLKVGDYAQTIWYDSIVVTGDLRWQDRLNSRNLSFFLASDAFFTNYTWPSNFPSLSAQYLLSLDDELMQGKLKSLRDIFVGVDVWPGRGSHGDGGFGLYKAIEHADPEFLGLSVALFGPAWTWESDEGSDGWNWETWWARERNLWVGLENEGMPVDVPDAPVRQGQLPCVHGPFRPVSEFFPRLPPPNPSAFPFFTSFSPGVGFAWFVEGRQVMPKQSGWTDVDKQTSLGDQLWPRPTVSWEGTNLDEPLNSSTVLNFTEAFNGGSSLTVKLAGRGGPSDEASFRCFWIPLQSLALSPGRTYEIQLVYKVSSADCDLDLALSVKADIEEIAMNINPIPSQPSDDFANGWSKISITCKPAVRTGLDVLASVGIMLGAAFDDASLPYSVDIQLGQLSAFPKSSPADATPYQSRLLWADCAPSNVSPSTLVLTWEACVSFTTPAIVRETDVMPEVPRPPWVLDRTPQWFPCFLYFNIYVQARRPDSNIGLTPSDAARFIGTSGTDGLRNRFSVDREALPEGLRTGPVRFSVQGVTDRGVVLPWESSVFVDCDL
ncbi:glycosyl hydrolase family 85-domain-containing protein [Phellopilus nigrolimitatus]|nr:glycosyl hydrolase family 85-domain-containing protein [Phellopilus nigrolimitatus]